MRWEHEVLEQRFEQVRKECDELYGKFVKAIHEVQQKSGFKNLLLEKKLTALADAIEKKVSFNTEGSIIIEPPNYSFGRPLCLSVIIIAGGSIE